MFKKIINPIRGVITLLLFTINMVLSGSVLLILVPLEFLIPWKKGRQKWHHFVHQIPFVWSDLNMLIIKSMTPTQIQVDDLDELNPQGWYLILSNHQSWVDIIILGSVFSRRIPMLKFFLKKQLIWLPFVGQCCWILDFPFMGRYSKDYLKKHPEMKGKDVEATRKSCEKFKKIPTTVINFCEGTRFTQEKHDRQASPYTYLLKPKAGGAAFVLNIMGEYLHQVLDVTLIYPQGRISMWDFLCGRVPNIIVKTRLLPVTPELVGNYESDTKFRQTFQKWLNEVWQHKDMQLTQVLGQPKMCKHYFISGKVQGVWFRAHTEEEAKKLNITGWVRNTEDGRVEVVACGTEPALQTLEQWLRKGPPKARVEKVEEVAIEHQEFKKFEKRA